jgi:hypothetical protein
MFFNAPEVSVTCAPALELQLVERFKIDVVILGIIGAIFAAVLYHLMLRYQVFFPGFDATRFAVATIAGIAFAFLLTITDARTGSLCLQKALGADSALGPEVPSIRPTWFGHVVANVWLAVVLDQLMYVLLLIAVVRVVRQVSWKGSL